MAVTFREANSFGGEALCDVLDCKRNQNKIQNQNQNQNQNKNHWGMNYFLYTICKYDPKT